MTAGTERGTPEGREVAMDAASDPRAAVRRMLETHAPCETGYPGKSTCEICVGGRECADALEAAMLARDPTIDWAPAIREVLGLW